MNGPTPTRVLGTAQVYQTLQQRRAGTAEPQGVALQGGHDPPVVLDEDDALGPPAERLEAEGTAAGVGVKDPCSAHRRAQNTEQRLAHPLGGGPDRGFRRNVDSTPLQVSGHDAKSTHGTSEGGLRGVDGPGHDGQPLGSRSLNQVHDGDDVAMAGASIGTQRNPLALPRLQLTAQSL